jgi:hypothetical protein
VAVDESGDGQLSVAIDNLSPIFVLEIAANIGYPISLDENVAVL